MLPASAGAAATWRPASVPQCLDRAILDLEDARKGRAEGLLVAFLKALRSIFTETSKSSSAGALSTSAAYSREWGLPMTSPVVVLIFACNLKPRAQVHTLSIQEGLEMLLVTVLFGITKLSGSM